MTKKAKPKRRNRHRFTPSPDIIKRSVTVEEAVAAYKAKTALWAHRVSAR